MTDQLVSQRESLWLGSSSFSFWWHRILCRRLCPHSSSIYLPKETCIDDCHDDEKGGSSFQSSFQSPEDTLCCLSLCPFRLPYSAAYFDDNPNEIRSMSSVSCPVRFSFKQKPEGPLKINCPSVCGWDRISPNSPSSQTRSYTRIFLIQWSCHSTLLFFSHWEVSFLSVCPVLHFGTIRDGNDRSNETWSQVSQEEGLFTRRCRWLMS